MALRFVITTFIGFIFLSLPAFSQTDSIGPTVDELLVKRDIAAKSFTSSAVILSRRGDVVIDDKGFEISHYYNAIYIADDTAVKDYSKLVSQFNSYYQEKKIDFARVITSEGKVIEMQKDAISLVSSNSGDYFDEGKQYEFALPQLKAGSIIEYQATTQQIKPYIEKEWFSSINFHFVKFLPSINWLRIDPVLETTNTLTVPKNIELSIVNYNIDIEPKLTKTAKNKIYTWRTTHQKGLELETEMPSLDDILPTVHLSTIQDWSTVNRWFNTLYLPTQKSDETIVELAKTIFHQDMNEYEKIKAVFDYMQKNVRYIGAHVNRGGYKPHLASEVLSQAYGDCKDQTVLIIALLKQAGIAAYPALINSYPGAKFSDELPMLNFDHMITYVETKTAKYWLDTSGETGTFPGINLNLEDKKALVVDEKEGRILQLPATTSADNIATVNIDFSLDKTVINAHVALDLSGHVETNLRNFIQFSPNALAATEQIMSPLLFNTRISDFKNSDPIDITKSFTLSANFSDIAEITSDIDNFRYSYDFSSILSVFTSFSNLAPVATRKFDFVVLQPITVVINSFYPQPWANSELGYSQPAQNIENKFFELTHQVQEKDNGVYVTSTFVLPKQVVKIDDYADFYQQVNDFPAHSQSLFVFLKPSLSTPKFVTSSGSDISSKIQHTKNLLEQSQFVQALVVIQEVIAENESNGEAQYLLGLALGFAGKDVKSEQAFERAEQLGYQY
ncbi:DUF3857 domain-containing protein [Colwellia sp. Arc7-635]|uniref:DUF3857 domain-containing transglutaminase family protein n=1 Tax=Colwellia sp. Arc7-635 TaxID=2497879 RepID=UPI000F856525|nr:DUF3857 domain-containing transglutaminase family protein [Colwellia sp. Arc7-635]AZQ82649.1 DUF3857 domain-containing protein [Colwellia sp. Arc7-635]